MSGGRGLLVFVLGGLVVAQRVVPVGLESVSDEPIIGVDREVTPACESGVVAGSLDVTATELVGFSGTGLQLGFARSARPRARVV